jgi:hypothetical protein
LWKIPCYSLVVQFSCVRGFDVCGGYDNLLSNFQSCAISLSRGGFFPLGVLLFFFLQERLCFCIKILSINAHLQSSRFVWPIPNVLK